MPSFTQAGRTLVVSTPLGTDVFVLVGFTGHEALSQLFSFQLDLFAEVATTIDFSKLLGAPIGVEVADPGRAKRHFHGMCSRVSEGEHNVSVRRYRIEVVPKIWSLTRSARCRVFQNKSVVDVLKTVFQGYDVEWKTTGKYEPRDYCVQYRETDFAFACRLMEDEGIFYFFRHEAGKHTLVVGDAALAHPDIAEPKLVTFKSDVTSLKELDRVFRWEKSQELRSGKYSLRDHCFEMPPNTLEVSQPIIGSVKVGTVDHKTNVGGNSALEVYDYPGGYAGRFDGIDKGGSPQAAQLQKIFNDGKRTVALRMEEETAPGIVVTGSSNCAHFVPGHQFSLTKHGAGDGAYVLAEVDHVVAYPWSPVGATSPAETVPYSNSFACIPAAQPFRPQRTTPTPVVHGAQTAVVVGPSGEEIFTDKYGRVRLQFFWDRDGKNDGAGACWVRVATHWAGKQWGAVHIPRIGQEVIVQFLEGDPDQPIVVGSVYNAEQMPPYALPDNKTQSGLKSRSTPSGAADNFNELRFEDKKGSEEICFHAEKDFNRVVENNDTLKVGSDKADDGSQTIEIWKNRTETVKEGDETVTIEKGNRTVTVKKGDDVHEVSEGKRTVTVKKDDSLEIAEGARTVTVSQGDETHEVKLGARKVTVGAGDETHEVTSGKYTLIVGGDDVHQIKNGNRTLQIDTGNDTSKVAKGNRSSEISMGNDDLAVKLGNQTTKLSAGKSSIDAMGGIELKVGGSSIVIDQSGVTIKGMMIKLEATVMLEAKGLMTDVKGDAMLTAKGAITMIG